MPTAGLRSKSWGEFARPDAPSMDFIFTVCDQAAGEVCPVWPGTPMTAHWGVADPDAATAAEVERAIWRAYRELETRIQLFTSLRLDELDRMSLKKRLDEIGKTRSEQLTPRHHINPKPRRRRIGEYRTARGVRTRSGPRFCSPRWSARE